MRILFVGVSRVGKTAIGVDHFPGVGLDRLPLGAGKSDPLDLDHLSSRYAPA